jgi:hypothetical protein
MVRSQNKRNKKMESGTLILYLRIVIRIFQLELRDLVRALYLVAIIPIF